MVFLFLFFLICSKLILLHPHKFSEYLNDGEATALTIDKDGWLHTGDVVYTDHDGYLYVVDRLKEIIKYKGFQVQITNPYHTTS